MGLSRDAQRRLARAVPWFTWAGAVGLALWLAVDVAGVGVSPGAAEVLEVQVASPRTAPVLSVRVTSGERVQKGQVLVELAPDDIDLEIAVAESELERLRLAVVAEAEGLKDQDLVTEERLASDAERAAVQLVEMEAEQRRDRAELEQLDEQIARQERLVKDKLASQAALDELKLRRAALARKVEEYTRLTDSARAHVASARRRIAEWREAHGGGKRDAEPRLSPHHAAVRSQEERLAQLRAARERLQLRSTADGRVGQVLFSPGSTAPAGATVLTVVDESPRKVIVYVDEGRAGAVRVGDRARLSPSDRRGPVREGRVVALAPGIVEVPPRFRPIPTEPAFGRAVYVRLDEAQATPLPGQAFDVTFTRSAAGGATP